MPAYIVITPAHNEERFIEKTVESMVAQTVRPLRWIVVNDASTDKTAEIVGRHSVYHPFIQLLNLERASGRHFGNKVRAFNLGLAKAQSFDFDFIGNLDADISLDQYYFEKVLNEFNRDPKLGVAGGMVHTKEGSEFVSQEVALDSVAGAVQLFRRQCFQQTGGYIALPWGGIDTAAEIMARKAGWKTRTFPEYPVLEHRLTGSATARPMGSRIKEGRRLHSLGYDPLFFVARCLYRLKAKPKIVGSLGALFGYFASVLRREPVALPPDIVRHLRLEQREKLKGMLRLPAYSRSTANLSAGRS